MGIITRQLPNSNPTRRAALKSAKQKKAGSPIATDVLRATTITYLDAQQPDYETKCVAVDNATTVSAIANAEKDVAQEDTRLYASHFIIVFNLMIRRGLIAKEERARYNLPIEGDALPYMDSEEAVQQVAENIAAGEAARVAAGGTAMSNPSAADVAGKLTTYLTKLTAASEKKDLLDTAQEDLDALNPGADNLILRIWDEVESYFNYETAESKRANAREWGVVYISVGSPTHVELTVLLPGGAPAVNREVKIPVAHFTANTDAEGKVALTTTVNGELEVKVKNGDGPNDYFASTITVVESVPFVGTIQLP